MTNENKYNYEELYSKLTKDIANTVVLYRKHNGITNKQLAEDLGVATSLISRIENGSKNISIKTLSKVLARMNATIEIKKND